MEKVLKDVYFYKGHDYCSNAYLLVDEKVKILIDSGNGELNFEEKPDYVFLTHGHMDHTLGSKEFRSYLRKEDFRNEFPYFKPPNAIEINFTKMKISSFDFEFIHTPGHTEGSMCIFEKKRKILFTGDTIFSDGWVGRTDLPGGNYKKLEESIKRIFSIFGKKIWKVEFPLDLSEIKVSIFPGHYELKIV
ncbi:MAG: MBL fold metallo-hydrolase [Candidatus Micrarchaeia archaeon]